MAKKKADYEIYEALLESVSNIQPRRDRFTSTEIYSSKDGEQFIIASCSDSDYIAGRTSVYLKASLKGLPGIMELQSYSNKGVKVSYFITEGKASQKELDNLNDPRKLAKIIRNKLRGTKERFAKMHKEEAKDRIKELMKVKRNLNVELEELREVRNG